MQVCEWHILFLIVLYTNEIVAPGNPSITPSVRMQVYNKFQRLHAYIMRCIVYRFACLMIV